MPNAFLWEKDFLRPCVSESRGTKKERVVHF